MKITISHLIPELNKICDQFGLEKKFCAYRNTPSGEHGYAKAYKIWMERRGLMSTQKIGCFTVCLAIIAQDKTKHFS